MPTNPPVNELHTLDIRQRYGGMPLLRLPIASELTQGKARPVIRQGWRTLRRIGGYLAQSRRRLLVTLSMILISSICAMAAPWLLGHTVDLFLVQRQAGTPALLVAILALLYIGQAAAAMAQSYLMAGVAQKTVALMRGDLFDHLHSLPIPFYADSKNGELMSRFTNDIDNISQTLGSSFIQLISSTVGFIGMLALMLYLSPALTAVTVLVFPLMHYGMRWITARTGPLFRRQQQSLGGFSGYIEEMFSGHALIKTFGREQAVTAEFARRNRAVLLSAYWAQTYSGFVTKLVYIIENLSFALIVGSGSLLAIQGAITIGVIVTFTEYARQLTRPVTQLATQINMLLSAIAGAERVFEVLDTGAEADHPAAQDLGQVRGALEFEGVGFSYGGEEVTLADLSFTVAPGQSVALVGPTGAGKSTVLQLIARFYETGSGSIRIDGVDIRDIRRASLRRSMAFVLQDSVLFDTTIRENIRYGRLDATDADVEQAARAANAHAFIMKLPSQFDTRLDQQASGISHGQRQLLAIARAILADPAILVLDEATSSIDTVTEIDIQAALATLMHGRTSLIIAHRLNTIRQADLIVVLDKGRSIEQGTHDELLARRGLYHRMHEAHSIEPLPTAAL